MKSPTPYLRVVRLHCGEDTTKWAVLYHDGTMTRLDTAHDTITTGMVLSKIFTSYSDVKSFSATQDGRLVERWADADDTELSMNDWGGENASTILYVTSSTLDGYEDEKESAYILVTLDPSILRLWIRRDAASEKIKVLDSSVEYWDLRTYGKWVAEELGEPVKLSAVRLKAIRGQLTGAIKMDKYWMVPAYTPWPSDRRKWDKKDPNGEDSQ